MFNKEKKQLKKNLEILFENAHKPSQREILVTFFEGKLNWSNESLAWLGIETARMMIYDELSYINMALQIKNLKFKCEYDGEGVWIDLIYLSVALRITDSGKVYVDG